MVLVGMANPEPRVAPPRSTTKPRRAFQDTIVPGKVKPISGSSLSGVSGIAVQETRNRSPSQQIATPRVYRADSMQASPPQPATGSQSYNDGRKRSTQRKRSTRTTQNFNSASKNVFDLLTAQDRLAQPSWRANHSGLPLLSDSNAKRWWDVAVAGCLLWLLVTVPLACGFELDTTWLLVLDTVAEAALLVDIAVSVCVVDVTLVTGRKTPRDVWRRCIRHYMRRWFLLDLLAALPLVGWLKLKHPARLVRYLRLAHFPCKQLPVQVAAWPEKFPFAVHSVCWAVGALLVVHTGACSWRAVDAAYGTSTTSVAGHVAGSRLAEAYVTYFYASFGAVVLIGHALLTPGSVGARILSITLSCCGIAGLCGLITSMTASSPGGWHRHRPHSVVVDSWLRHWSVPEGMRQRVQEELAARGLSAIVTQRTVLSSLSAKLRREVLLHVSSTLARKAPLLASGSLGFRECVIPLLKPSSAQEGDFVLLYG